MKEQALLSNASAGFQRIYRGVRLMTEAIVAQVAELKIEAVDLRAEVLSLPPAARGPAQTQLRHQTRELLGEAIGPRTRGPVFLTPRRKQWCPKTVSLHFSRARTRAGLPSNIMLRGQRQSA